MINKKTNCHKSLFYLILMWVLCFSIRRAYLAPIFDHEANCYLCDGYFYEANGWFFILLLQCLKRWFGASLFIVRILPVLANLGICCLTYKIAEYIYDKKIALLALFLYAINPMAYFYASYSRFYAFGVFFILLAFYLTVQACESGSSFVWSAAAVAYLCAFNSWILTFVVMISIWTFMVLFMKMDRNNRERLLRIAVLISLNFIILQIFDSTGAKRISNETEFSIYQFMYNIFGMSGMSSFSETLADFLSRMFSLQREYIFSGLFYLLLMYSIFSLAYMFKMGMDKAGGSKYSPFPFFVFSVSVLIFALFSFFSFNKASFFNYKNMFLLLPMWIVMFSVIAVRLRIIVLLVIALSGGTADYICFEGYAPESQMRAFADKSYEMYLSNNRIEYIMTNRNIKIGNNVHYKPYDIESLSILLSALKCKKVSLLLTDLRKEKMIHFVNKNNPGLKVYIYGEVEHANIRAYLIVPSVRQ